MERERDIERWLRCRIRRMGGRFMKFVSPGEDGVPDRIAVMPGGRVWFVELKTDNGRLTSIQAWQIEQLRGMGARVAVVRGMVGARIFIDQLLRDAQRGG